MFATKKSKKTIDDEIQNVLEALDKEANKSSEEYQKTVDNLKVLCEARSLKKANRFVDTDVLVAAFTNLAGILLILHYEELHVVSSKALGFIAKGRIT